MKTAVTASLSADEFGASDRICRQEGMDRAEAPLATLRRHIAMEGHLPPPEDPAAEDIYL